MPQALFQDRALFDDEDGTLAMLRDSVRAFAARRPGAAALREKRAAGADIDARSWAAIVEAGWTTLLLPEDLGGPGLGMREQVVLSEALGAALICEPTAILGTLTSAVLGAAPASSERSNLAERLASGVGIVAPAWIDASAPLRAVKDGGFRLNGGKLFVEAARAATEFLVTATHDGEALLLSLPASAAGLSIAERPSVDGASLASLSFLDCHVPDDRLVARGPIVGVLLDAAIQHARLALAAELTGLGCRALEATIAYVRDRVQFGKPIASFQVVQHRLVDMWMDAELARASIVNAVEAFEGADERVRQLAVLAAKARAGDAAVSICRRCVHLHGAMGFTDECDIGLFLKRVIALNATLGQAETLRLEFVDVERAA